MYNETWLDFSIINSLSNKRPKVKEKVAEITSITCHSSIKLNPGTMHTTSGHRHLVTQPNSIPIPTGSPHCLCICIRISSGPSQVLFLKEGPKPGLIIFSTCKPSPIWNFPPAFFVLRAFCHRMLASSPRPPGLSPRSLASKRDVVHEREKKGNIGLGGLGDNGEKNRTWGIGSGVTCPLCVV